MEGGSQEGGQSLNGNFTGIDLVSREEFADILSGIPVGAQHAVTEVAKVMKALHDEHESRSLIADRAEQARRTAVAENVNLLARIGELEARVAEMEGQLRETRETRDARIREVEVRDARIREVEEDCNTRVNQLQEELTTLRPAIDRARETFMDATTLNLAECPIPLSDGSVMDLNSIIQVLVMPQQVEQGLFFDGTVNSTFQHPQTRQPVRVLDANIIRFVHNIAASLGMRITGPYTMQHSLSPIGQNPIVWRDYPIEAQLGIFLKIVELFRGRIDPNAPAVAIGNASVTAQPRSNHFLRISRARNVHIVRHADPNVPGDRDEVNVTWDITFSLLVIRNDNTAVNYHVRMHCNRPFPTRGFRFTGVAAEMQPPA